MEQFKDWKKSSETVNGSVFFHYPKNENEFKNAAKEYGGIIIHIYDGDNTLKSEEKAVVSKIWTTPIFTYVQNMTRDGLRLKNAYKGCSFFIVPKSYEEKLNEIEHVDQKIEKTKGKESSLENILTTSEIIAEIYKDKEILFKKINSMEEDEIRKVFEIYRMEKANDFGVVKLIRYAVAKLLIENQTINHKIIDDLKNRIKNADTEYFSYLPVEVKERFKNYKTKQGGNPFQAWTNDAKILFPFFYSGEIKDSIENSLSKIAQYLEEKAEIIDSTYEILNFSGSQHQGRDHLSIAFFPKNMKLQNAFQHYIKFYNGEIYVGIFKGKNIDNAEFEAELKKVFSLKEAADVIVSNKDKIRELNSKSVYNAKEREKVESMDDDNNAESSIPLNLILYGPPGTGKTYHTINKALEIIIEKEKDNDVVCDKKVSEIKNIIKEDFPTNEERKILQEAFKFFKEKGQIEFITFHQSYSYEDFVEGIKPIPPKEDENQSEEMVFRTQPGVFKRICDEAIIENFLEDYSGKKFYRIALGRKNENPTERLKYCYEKNLIGLGYSGYKTDLSNYKNEEEIKKTANGDVTGCKMLNYLVNVMKDGDIVFVTEGQNIVAICEIKGNYSFSENPDEIMIGYEHQRSVKWIKKDINLSVKKLFSYKTVPGNSLSPIIFEKKDVVSNFVLIIDEINRGNISKIFGELITLIEDDKRLGKENEMTVTLPYSKDSFGVPANLHIVGTMNTADRSIALMDMALRRRFSFQEMMPEIRLLDFEVKGIKINELLKKINERIEFLYDRDHTIGHAYFIKLKNNPDYKELCSIFANKIIPLLQEYFYEDWEKIQIVLGDHESQKNKKKDNDKMVLCDEKSETDVIGFNHPEIDDKRKIYSLNDTLKKGEISPETFIKIYEPSEPVKKSDEEQKGET